MTDTAGAGAATESTLSNWVGPYVTDMLGRASALADQPYTAYTGPLTAGASSLQTDAFTGLGSLDVPQTQPFDPTAFSSSLSYSPTAYGNADPLALNSYGATDPYAANAWDWNDPNQGGAGGFQYNEYGPTGTYTGESWTNPANYTNYMSPFIQQALAPQLDEARRQAEIDRVQNAGRMTRAGAYGGSRQAIMESELQDNSRRLMDQIFGTGIQRAYESGMGQFNTEESARRDQFNRDRDVGLGQNRWANEFLAGRSDTDINRRLGQFNLEEGNRRDQFNLEDMRDWERWNTEEARRIGQRNLEEDRYRDQFNIDEDRTMQNYQDQIERARQQHNIEQGLEFQSNEADRGYGLSLLNNMLAAGQTQRGIESEGIAADMAQFNQERDYPYAMVQYLQSMLQGLPVQTNAYSYYEPSGISTALGTAGSILDLINRLYPTGNTNNTTPNT